MRKIKIFDYSLKKLGEDGSLLFREKAAIAECIDSFGIDSIELPPIENLKEDAIIYKTISSIVSNCELCIPAGMDEESIMNAFDCIKTAKKPCLQIEVPVSTVTMEYRYHLKADKMCKKVAELCGKASAVCDNVEFVAEDATRASVDFLVEIINIAAQNGAKSATVCDDAGVATPKDFEELVKRLKKECSVPIYVKVSDALKMAPATALYAVMAGADGIKTTVSGKGELKTADIAAVLESQKDALGVSFGLKTTELKSDISELVKKVKPTAKPEKRDSENDGILLDPDSTIEDVQAAAQKLGYNLSAEDSGKVYKALTGILEKKPSIGNKELEALIASAALEVPSTYHLESYTVSISNLSTTMSNVVLTKDGEKLMGTATGDGPIDSSFFAIEQCIGYHYELDSFEIEAITEGKEALGSTVVRLRSNGKLFSGIGISSDIVGASIRAYINALNKIVYEEGQA